MTTLQVHPLAGHIGAELTGIRVGGDVRDDDVAAVRQALLDWKVVFLGDQPVSQAEHVAFGRWFGQVTPAHPTLPVAFPEHPEILLLEHQDNDGPAAVPTMHLVPTDVPSGSRRSMQRITIAGDIPVGPA